jgi:tetratricopeptide (TPR) repeat protein
MGDSSSGLDKVSLLERANEALGDAYKSRKETGEFKFLAIFHSITLRELNLSRFIGAPVKDLILSRNTLASLKAVQGQLNEAEANLRESLSEAKKHLPPDDTLFATTLNNLGYVLKKTNYPVKWDEALECYEQAFKIRRYLSTALLNILQMN